MFDDGIYGCDGECITDTDGDGICDQNELGGCTDAGACNFDASATTTMARANTRRARDAPTAMRATLIQKRPLDGSCFFPGDPRDDAIALTEGDVIQADCECLAKSRYDPDACNYSEEGISDESLFHITLYDIKTRSLSLKHPGLHLHKHGRRSYEWTATGYDIVGGQGDNVVSVVWNVEGTARFALERMDGCSGEEVASMNITLTSVDELLEGTLDVFPVP